MRVFLLSHRRNEQELDGYKIIGVFSSEGTARDAIEQLKSLPGFRDYPENFEIGGYDLDKIFWVGGFGFE